MEELLADSKIEQLKEGSVISGTIMEIRPTEVVIDFGGKAEGEVPVIEFIDPSELEIGSDIEVFLERLEVLPEKSLVLLATLFVQPEVEGVHAEQLDAFLDPA